MTAVSLQAGESANGLAPVSKTSGPFLTESETKPLQQQVSQPPLISAVGLSKVYRMGEQTVRALDDVSLNIEAGDYVAIMGASGSGKSTMMNLIGALDVPTSGSLSIGGRDISTLSSDELADLRNVSIGFVFQQFNLLARTTALNQVMLPLLYARPRPKDLAARARARLEHVGLGARLDHLPSQLSGGQQQRVAIARALINNPKLLLADEPTGALDTKTSEEIMSLFAELNREGITIVIVTHEPDIAEHARRKIVFRDGRIVDDSGSSVAKAASNGAAS
jgi:putative ABC transport system ATP-binding protein